MKNSIIILTKYTLYNIDAHSIIITNIQIQLTILCKFLSINLLLASTSLSRLLMSVHESCSLTLVKSLG